ncbi:MAG: LysR family transcriptional regulator [Stappia sp.]|uniref:LysR substrate-binding domain-containing protein n=1 Tax=Stappia sp. TaxID=1870903 RepID=UPI000C3B42EA|nr:LysR substrate-binding domain-containing protein [Stappia sp.]MAB00823.1 LysR family transcriptional regulator [Stappia sp.]MBM18976.1 LysR family transcriptional regulator [Stappia sp.]
MSEKSPPIPRLNVPLNALRAFEAAGRHVSIKKAAGELGVTPSAVSHQVRQLEDSLGVDLLRRIGSRLELTEAGGKLLPGLSSGFREIASSVAETTGERKSGPLRLSMLATFAVHWLSPRLAEYPFDRAGFELLISTSQTAVDLSAGAADAGIRHGSGSWPGLKADLLFEESVTLFAAPSLIGGRDPRAVVARANLFLSQHRVRNWDEWNGSLPDGPVSPANVTMVDSAGLGLRAAIDGVGITLAGREIARTDVTAGRLVPLFEHATPGSGGYWLVYPDPLARDRRIQNLRDWILREVASRP